MPVISALRRLRQMGNKFKTSLGCTVISCLQKRGWEIGEEESRQQKNVYRRQGKCNQ
jgi:hypothetical protein